MWVPPRMRHPPACLRRCGVLGPWMGRRPRDHRFAPRGWLVARGRRHARCLTSVPRVPYWVGGRPVPSRLRVPPCPAGDWLARWRAGFLAGPSPRYVSPLGVVPGQVGPPLAVALLSAAGVPTLPPRRPRGFLALWLDRRCGRLGCLVCQLRRRSDVAIWHGCRPGLASHVACQCSCAAISLCRGGPGCRCPALGMWDPVSSSQPGAFACGALAGTMACVGSGSRSGLGSGDCQMVFPWAVLTVWLMGRGVVGVPARPVPGSADGAPELRCWVLLELGDLGSRRRCGRGGVWC